MLGRFGLRRVRHPGIMDVIRHHNIQTVLDVGAKEGLFGTALRESGFKGRIFSFEPITEMFDRLHQRTHATLFGTFLTSL